MKDYKNANDRLSRKEEASVIFYIIGLALFFGIGVLWGLAL